MSTPEQIQNRGRMVRVTIAAGTNGAWEVQVLYANDDKTVTARNHTKWEDLRHYAAEAARAGGLHAYVTPDGITYA